HRANAGPAAGSNHRQPGNHGGRRRSPSSRTDTGATTSRGARMKIRTAQGLTLMLFALVMGVFWGTWFSLSRTMNRLSARTFLDIGQQMIHNLAVPMAILTPVALLAAATALALLWSARPTPAFWWLLAGFLLMVGAVAVTLLVEVPIDNQIKTWTVQTL